jgi:hypothetical protein
MAMLAAKKIWNSTPGKLKMEMHYVTYHVPFEPEEADDT